MALRGGLRSWHGEAIKRRAEAAAKAGIDETLAACVARAQASAPVDTGFLRASAFVRQAVLTASGMLGHWGFSAAYAAYVEFGTVRMGAQPYIRPAMDIEYPKLARRIKAHFSRG